MKKTISILAVVLIVAALFVGCNAENNAKLVTVGFSLGDGSKALATATQGTGDDSPKAAIDYYEIKVTDESSNAYRYLKFWALNAEDATELTDYSTRGTSNYTDGASSGTYVFKNVKKALIDNTTYAPKFVLSQGVWTFEVIGYSAANKQIVEGKLSQVRVSNATSQIEVIVGASYVTGEYVDLTIIFGGEATTALTTLKADSTPKTPTSTGTGYFVLTVDGAQEADKGTVTIKKEFVYNSETTSNNVNDQNGSYYIERNADNNTYLMGSSAISVQTGWRTVKVTYQTDVLDEDGETVKETIIHKTYQTRLLVTKDGKLTFTGDFVGKFAQPSAIITEYSLVIVTAVDYDNKTISVSSVTLGNDSIDLEDDDLEFAWTIAGAETNSTTLDAGTLDFTEDEVDFGQFEVEVLVTYTSDVSKVNTPYKATDGYLVEWDGATLKTANDTRTAWVTE